MPWQIYSYKECALEAIQLTTETQFEIFHSLLKDNKFNKINYLFATTNTVVPECLVFDFKYYDDLETKQLRVTDYLVKLATGRYGVCTAEEFEKYYYNDALDEGVEPQPENTASPDTAVKTFIKNFADTYGLTELESVENIDDLTDEQVVTLMNALKIWYDEENNVFTAKFADCGIVDPTGLSKVLNKLYPGADYFTPDTSFVLDFNNGAEHAKADEDMQETQKYNPNFFDYEALRKLEDEIDDLLPVVVSHISSVTMQNEGKATEDAEKLNVSPLAPSVTLAQWDGFVTWLTTYTACTADSVLR